MIQIIPDLININKNLSNISFELRNLNDKSFFDSNAFSAIIGFASAIFVLFLDKLFLTFKYNKNKNKKIFIEYIKKLQLKDACYFIKEQDFDCIISYEKITKLIDLAYYKDKFDISFLKDKKLKKITIDLINNLEEFEDLFSHYSENITNAYKISHSDNDVRNSVVLKLNNQRQSIFNKYKKIEEYFFKKY